MAESGIAKCSCSTGGSDDVRLTKNKCRLDGLYNSRRFKESDLIFMYCMEKNGSQRLPETAGTSHTKIKNCTACVWKCTWCVANLFLLFGSLLLDVKCKGHEVYVGTFRSNFSVFTSILVHWRMWRRGPVIVPLHCKKTKTKKWHKNIKRLLHSLYTFSSIFTLQLWDKYPDLCRFCSASYPFTLHGVLVNAKNTDKCRFSYSFISHPVCWSRAKAVYAFVQRLALLVPKSPVLSSTRQTSN